MHGRRSFILYTANIVSQFNYLTHVNQQRIPACTVHWLHVHVAYVTADSGLIVDVRALKSLTALKSSYTHVTVDWRAWFQGNWAFYKRTSTIKPESVATPWQFSLTPPAAVASHPPIRHRVIPLDVLHASGAANYNTNNITVYNRHTHNLTTFPPTNFHYSMLSSEIALHCNWADAVVCRINEILFTRDNSTESRRNRHSRSSCHWQYWNPHHTLRRPLLPYWYR